MCCYQLNPWCSLFAVVEIAAGVAIACAYVLLCWCCCLVGCVCWCAAPVAAVGAANVELLAVVLFLCVRLLRVFACARHSSVCVQSSSSLLWLRLSLLLQMLLFLL